MNFSELRTTLLRILEIDEKIKDIQHGRNYLALKRNLKTLENPTKGYIIIDSPDDMKTAIKLRKNSSEVQVIKLKYREMLRRDTEKLSNLRKEQRQLRNELPTAS
jgi:hypothetical protein